MSTLPQNLLQSYKGSLTGFYDRLFQGADTTVFVDNAIPDTLTKGGHSSGAFYDYFETKNEKPVSDAIALIRQNLGSKSGHASKNEMAFRRSSLQYGQAVAVDFRFKDKNIIAGLANVPVYSDERYQQMNAKAESYQFKGTDEYKKLYEASEAQNSRRPLIKDEMVSREMKNHEERFQMINIVRDIFIAEFVTMLLHAKQNRHQGDITLAAQPKGIGAHKWDPEIAGRAYGEAIIAMNTIFMPEMMGPNTQFKVDLLRFDPNVESGVEGYSVPSLDTKSKDDQFIYHAAAQLNDEDYRNNVAKISSQARIIKQNVFAHSLYGINGAKNELVEYSKPRWYSGLGFRGTWRHHQKFTEKHIASKDIKSAAQLIGLLKMFENGKTVKGFNADKSVSQGGHFFSLMIQLANAVLIEESAHKAAEQKRSTSVVSGAGVGAGAGAPADSSAMSDVTIQVASDPSSASSASFGGVESDDAPTQNYVMPRLIRKDDFDRNTNYTRTTFFAALRQKVEVRAKQAGLETELASTFDPSEFI